MGFLLLSVWRPSSMSMYYSYENTDFDDADAACITSEAEETETC
jgi:hypothetical protein